MIVRPRRGRVLSLMIAIISVALMSVVVSWWREPTVIVTSLGETRELTEAQEQTIDIVKELNGYLISLTTLMFGGLGWYLTQQRPSPTMPLQTAFFSAACLLVMSFRFAAMTYAELTSELGQNVLGLVAGQSRVLYYLELQVIACGTAAVLILVIFADVVTRQKSG
jgi:hypothetical protein